MTSVQDMINQNKGNWPIRLMVVVQIFLVGFLGVFIFNKSKAVMVARSVTNPPSIAQESNTNPEQNRIARVAGAFTNSFSNTTPNSESNAEVSPENVSTQYVIPEKIVLRIEDRVRVLNTADFGFDLLYPKLPEKSRREKVVSEIRRIIKREPKVAQMMPDPRVVLNQGDLEDWLKVNFAGLEDLNESYAEITYGTNEDGETTNQIVACTKAEASKAVPFNQIVKDLRTPAAIGANMSYGLIVTELSESEKGINSICDEIDRVYGMFDEIEIEDFEDVSITAKYKFIEKEDLGEVISIYDNEGSFYAEIINEEILRQKLTSLKTFLDVEVEEANYEIVNNNLYVLGDFEPGRYMNVDETVIALQEVLIDLSTFEFIPFVFDEVSEQERDVNLDVVELPNVIAKSEIAIPLNPLVNSNAVKSITKFIDGTVVEPGTEFSLVEALSSFSNEISYSSPSVVNTDTVRIVNYENLSVLASGFYRALMQTELPITSYQSQVTKPDGNIFPTQNGNNLLTSIVLPSQPEFEIDLLELPKEEQENRQQITSQLEDLKFVNKYDVPIFIKITHDLTSEGFYTFITFYTPKGTTPLGDEPIILNVEQFETSERTIRENGEEFLIEYY